MGWEEQFPVDIITLVNHFKKPSIGTALNPPAKQTNYGTLIAVQGLFLEGLQALVKTLLNEYTRKHLLKSKTN
jgi:predicted RNA-binding protein Jag